ncbi:TPA: hypothetical protein ACIVF2_004487, partial [Salmonella enterica subsp. enterica serovar 16:l,v:-]
EMIFIAILTVGQDYLSATDASRHEALIRNAIFFILLIIAFLKIIIFPSLQQSMILHMNYT